ncbi:TPA: hypothetical protein N0F65_011100 [Lagenidium giganteum]|uniref:CCHC-type domain-containing protein n=1 Tax=Lagenidium giganteum TaxID=4803 RepID=A0AAV2ZCU1_9STRA|nr:TPA: hypothetical protein N0F65_011100 [Lagenidium giganteum]
MYLTVKLEKASFGDADFNGKSPGSRLEKPLYDKKNRFSRPGKKFPKQGRFKPERNDQGDKAKRSIMCHYCKKPGHIKSECRFFQAKQGSQENDKPRQT